MPAATSETIALVDQTVTVAPLVLLSAVDHYNRTAKGSKRRAVGVLLGENTGKIIRVTNSFAVPFEEDEKNPNVWFLDHNYVDAMSDMYKKINAREKIIGWYHTGPKLRSSDLSISNLFKKYTPNPLLVIIDVEPKDVSGVPTDAYFAVEEIRDDGTTTVRTFVHTPSIIEAEEAEEIGVEHLLRDVRDAAVGSLSTRITSQLESLKGLDHRLGGIAAYLENVLTGKLPINHIILGKLQDVFNLLPNLSNPLNIATAKSRQDATGIRQPDLSRAFTIKTNDQLMTIFLSSLIRAIIAFHNLIDNKIENKAFQKSLNNVGESTTELENHIDSLGESVNDENDLGNNPKVDQDRGI